MSNPLRRTTPIFLSIFVLFSFFSIQSVKAQNSLQTNSKKKSLLHIEKKAIDNKTNLNNIVKQTLKKNAQTLRFMENKGQFTDSNILYYFQGNNGDAYIEKDKIVFVAKDLTTVETKADANNILPKTEQAIKGTHTFNLHLDGSNPFTNISLGSSFATTYNYFLNPKNTNGITNVKAAKDLTIRNIYSGIDLRLYSTKEGNLEFDWILQPKADYNKIKLNFEGQDNLSITAEGKLKVGLRFTDVFFNIPESYQVSEKNKIPVKFAFNKINDNNINFKTSSFINPNYSLVIDPVLNFGTYMDGNIASGNQFDQYLFALQVDSSTGIIYCAGASNKNIPTSTSPYDATGYLNTITGLDGAPSAGIPCAAVVYRISADGSDLMNLTLFGPATLAAGNTIQAYALSLSNNNVFIGGITNVDLPVTVNAFDNTREGTNDGFVAVFPKNLGSLTYATYLGSSGNDTRGVTCVRAVDDNSFVVGMTTVAALSTSSPNYISASAAQTTFGGTSDFYIAKFTSFNSLSYGTYVGGSSAETFNDLEVLSDGRIAFCGYGTGTLTEVNSAATGSAGADEDGIIGVLNATATSFNYLDEIGGTGNDRILDLEYALGKLYWTGLGTSGFPVTVGAYDVSNNGGNDAVVGAVDVGGSTGFKATFYGTSGSDLGNGIKLVNQVSCSGIQANPFLLVFGTVGANGLPTVNINNEAFYDDTYNGGTDIFFAGFTSNLDTLFYGTYIGGTGNDYLGNTGDPRGANHLWVDGSNIYCGTTTHSAAVQPSVLTNGFDLTKDNTSNDSHLILSIQVASLTANDYSDAPASYGTPYHSITCASPRIGATEDYESGAMPTVGANGDDLDGTDDEDGVNTLPVLTNGTQNVSVTVNNLYNQTGSTANLYAWIDFNGDGQFSANEFTSTTVATGTNAGTKTLTWTGVTVSGSASSHYLRLRFTTNNLTDNAGTASVDERSTVAAGNGEVEDYLCVTLTCPSNQSELPCQTQSAINAKFAAWLATASAGGGCTGSFTNNAGSAPSVTTSGTATVIFTYTSTCSGTTPTTSAPTCSATFTVQAPDITTPVVTVTQPTCSVSTGTITVTSPTGVGITYSKDGVNYQSSATFSSVASGSYNITAKSANGCISNITLATVNAQPSTPAAPTVSITQPTCSVATGTITVTAPIGAGITYSKDGLNYQASTTFTGLAAGSYSITAKSSAGCVSTATNATVNAQPSTPAAPTVTLTQPTCSVATGTITVTAPIGAGITYSIDGINYQSSTTFSSVASGFYSVTSKNASGCVSTVTSATINAQPSTPSAPSVSITQPTCTVSTGTITVNSPSGAGITYSKDGINYQASNVFNNVASGSYPITAKGTNGCVSAVTIAVVNAQPALSAAPTVTVTQPTCSVATGTITITSPLAVGTTYSIDGVNYQASTTFNSVAPGTYSVTSKSGAGCVSSAISVVVNAQPITLNPAISPSGSVTGCVGGGLILTSTPAASYQWYKDGVLIPGAVGQTYSPTASGSYTVEVTSVTGCTSISAATVVTLSTTSPTTIAANGPTNICSSASVQLCPGVWGWSNYQWYLNGVAIAAPIGTSACITVNTAGSYTLSVQNGSGCWSDQSAPVVVTVSASPSTPTISAGGSTTFCAGGNVTLTSSNATGNQWYLNGSAIAGATNQTYNATLPGTYTVTTSNGSCESVASAGVAVVISNPIAPTLSSPSTELCSGSITLTSNIALGNQWYLNGVLIPGATNQTYNATVTGTYTVVNTQGTCVINSSNSITLIGSTASPTTIAAAYGTIVCTGGTIQLCPAVWGWANYQWYENGVAIPAPAGTSACIDVSIAATYTLAVQNGSGCWTNQSAGVTTTLGGACSVSSGGSGGVETKSLGDVISKRLYGYAVTNKSTEVNYATASHFTQTNGTVINGANNLTLAELFPSSAYNTTDFYVTTPTDLINITNALEVLAVDYTKNNITKAVAFGTKTLGGIYEHTKPICDRLKAAELKSVSSININGYTLLVYKIIQHTGQIEYAINLSAGVNSSNNNITLQSNWFTDNYLPSEKIFNFQLWAVDVTTVRSLAENIIYKLQQRGTLIGIAPKDIPTTFVEKGRRRNDQMELTIQNNTLHTSGYFSIKEKANENSAETYRQVPFTLNATSNTQIKVPVADYYESSIYVYLNGKLVDLVYLSDGTWNIDYDKNSTTINTFNIDNNASVVVNANELNVMRNVNVDASVKNYISIYKTINGGGLQEDLTNYNTLKFNASLQGVSSMVITFVKKSITNWNNQYNIEVQPNTTGEYSIDLNSLKAAGLSGVNLNDVVAINFALINRSSGGYANIVATLSNLRFTNKAVNSNVIELDQTIAVKPNPNSGLFTASFNSNTDMPLQLSVTELSTGRKVSQQIVSAKKGNNKFVVSLDKNLINGIYVVTLDGDNIKYNPAKLIISKN